MLEDLYWPLMIIEARQGPKKKKKCPEPVMVLRAWLRCIHYGWRPLGALLFLFAALLKRLRPFAEPSRDVREM